MYYFIYRDQPAVKFVLKMAQANADTEQRAASMVEQLCFAWLVEADVDLLQGFCDEYRIEVADDKIGKKDCLLKLVLRYLNSEDLENTADKGATVFMKLFSELGESLGKGKASSGSSFIKGDPGMPKRDNVPESVPEHVVTESVIPKKFSVHKLKEFKIKGKIGDPKKDGSLSYTSLVFQMQQGKEQGFSSSEVCAAVIQAIEPGHSLRGFLESKDELSEDALLLILRSHLNEKDSTSFFHELSNCVQKPGENAHSFVVNALLLREKVAKISAEEGCPFDENMLSKRFFHTVYTGLRSNNIRMELQLTLKDGVISDEDLLMEVCLASANEQERLGKAKSKTDLNINAISFNNMNSHFDSESASNSSSSSETVDIRKSSRTDMPKQDSKILAEIAKLSAKINELSSVKDEVNELRENLRGVQNVNYQRPIGRGRGGRFFRCKKCDEENRSYCSHCFKCGSGLHKAADCPNSPPPLN